MGLILLIFVFFFGGFLSVLPPSHAAEPLATLVAPTEGAQLQGTGVFTARSSDATIATTVQWCMDNTPIPGTVARNGADYTMSIDTKTFIDGPHTVRVSARVGTGPTLVTLPATVTINNSVPPPPPAPPVPTGLTAAVVSTSQIDLTWQAPATPDVTGYHIYRDGVHIDTVNTPTLSMACLFPATTYAMTVVALYGDSTLSGHSTIVTATTLGGTTADTIPPTVPTDVHAIALSFNQATVLWTASTDNIAVASYEVKQDGISLGASADAQRLVTGLSPSTSYVFIVTAVDVAGNRSTPSEGATVVTFPLPPTHSQPLSFKMHHDTIPNFAQSFTIQSSKSGAWSDPSSWSNARVPNQADIVLVTHPIIYDSTTGDVDTVGVDMGGILTFKVDTPTKLLLKTLLVMPQGILQIGSAQEPIAANVTAEIIIKDTPINTTTDPAQYGHGILAINGTVTMHGAKKEPTFLRLSTEPKAGDATLLLSSPPVGWQVGDRLVIPDTRQLAWAEVGGFDQINNIIRLEVQSEVATVHAINGSTLTLTAPLRFDHLGARDTQGKLDFLPHVGNLSRNIVIRSANPAGTRGHTLFTGVSAIDVRYAGFYNLGRTQAEPLNNTTFDSEGIPTRIGTNQIGRYPLHNHHNYGPCLGAPYQFTYLGNVIDETGRWGMTFHGSHYGLIKDNIVYNVKGAGIATEDGSETENVFEHNFIVRVENNTRLTALEAGGNVDPLGRKGNSFWFRGAGSILRNNVMADAREGVGIYIGSEEGNGINSLNISVNVPSFRCAQTTVPGQFRTIENLWQVPNREFEGNEIYSTSEFGLSTWFFPGLGAPLRNTTIWHAHSKAIFIKYGDITFDGLIIRNKGGAGEAIVQFNNFGGGGPMAAVLRRADVQGVDVVYRRGGQIALAPNWTITDSDFVSRQGFILDANGQGLDASKWVFNNVKFGDLPGAPLKAITTVFNKDTFDRANLRHDTFVTAYQGNPQDNFRIYFAVQAPGAIAYHLDQDFGLGSLLQGCPVGGMTNQQCWDQHGVTTFQELAPCVDTTTHPEIGGFTCK